MRLLHNSNIDGGENVFFKNTSRWFLDHAREVLESQSDKFLLWVPIALACGIGLYFSLSFEPRLLWAAPVIVIFAFANIRLFSQGHYLSGLLFLFVLLLPALGFCASILGTKLYGTPMLERELGPVSLIGTVETMELLDQANDVRLLLSDLVIDGLSPDETPKKVRLRFKKAPEGLFAGQRIKLLVKLMPNSGPLIPGGFDFRRHFFFQGIGAVGFIFRMEGDADADAIEAPEKTRSSHAHILEKIRGVIALRIHNVLSGDQANVVEALVIGRRAGIADEVYDDLRHSGLAHLLAISGLHIGLVAGALFFFLRLGLSCSERLALYYPIKKYAAVCAILGAFIYMMLAGAPIPTQRAMIMTTIIFGAILLDRWPFSLRAVAVAAFIILLIAPHSLLSVSFQLSFAAVTALVAASEFMLGRWQSLKSKRGAIRRVLLYFGGVAMTSLLAALATAPFALYHFQQLALLGVLANMVAIPIMAFWVMPCGIVSLLLMPFGLEALALALMGQGVDIIIHTATYVSKMDHSVLTIPQFSFSSFVFIVLAGIGLIAFKGGLRRVSVVSLILLAVLSFHLSNYKILVSQDFDLTGFVNERKGEPLMALSSLKRDKFTADIWANALNVSIDRERDLYRQEGMRCDSDACRYEMDGLHISLPRNDYAFLQECVWADLILADFYAESACPDKIMIDRRYLWRNGAVGIRLKKRGKQHAAFVVDRARTTANRPWSE